MYIQFIYSIINNYVLFSAECTIGMVWGVGVPKALWHCGNKALWHYGNKV